MAAALVDTVTCEGHHELIDITSHTITINAIGIALLIAGLVLFIRWLWGRYRDISIKELNARLGFGILSTLFGAYCIVGNYVGRQKSESLAKHCKLTIGTIVGRNHLIRPSRWEYKTEFKVRDINFRGSNVYQGSHLIISEKALQVDSTFYLVAYDSTEPANSVLDATTIIR